MKKIFLTLLILLLTSVSYAGNDIAALDIDQLDGSSSLLASPTFTGISTFPAGSVTAPSIVSDDADSGFYFGSKGFNWGVDGVNKFSINSGGILTVAGALVASQLYKDGGIDIQNYGSSSTVTQLALVGGTLSHTSGTIVGVKIYPTYNQASGTAANTDLKIAPTLTAIGSGEQIGLQISRGTFATADTVNHTHSMIKIDGTLGILDGTDVWNGLNIAPTDTANHTGGSINGIKFGSITADANATEIMVNLTETTPSWDADLVRSNKAITCSTNVCTDVPGAYAVYITTESDATPDVLAIADGIAGQEKLIILKGAGTDDLTITPANYGSGTSITCTTTGFTAKLHFDGTNWQVVSLFGCTDD